ncbi:STAS domain-containing protein [Kitasatospora sp. NPDC058162]
MESGLSTLAVLGELVVDMSRVAFCDSGGLNALIRARLQAREAGAELHLLCPTGLVVDLLCRTRAAQVLRVSPDPAATTLASGRSAAPVGPHRQTLLALAFLQRVPRVAPRLLGWTVRIVRRCRYEPTRERDVAVPAPACFQSGGLVAMGRGGDE